jgi:hypothetical protein
MAFEQDPQTGNVAFLGYPDKLRVADHHLASPPSWLHSKPLLIKKMRGALKKFPKGARNL